MKKHIIVSLVISFVLYLIFAIEGVNFNIALWSEPARFTFSMSLFIVLFVNVASYIERNK